MKLCTSKTEESSTFLSKEVKNDLSNGLLFSNLVHVSLVVPRLDVEEDGGLGDEGGLLGLLLVIRLQPLLRDSLLLLTLLFVRAATIEKECDSTTCIHFSLFMKI